MSLKKFTINWKELSEKMPSGKSDEDKKKRDKLWKMWDPNANGFLSLAEIDLGIKKIMKSEDLFHAKPAILRAFQKAKGSNNKNSK